MIKHCTDVVCGNSKADEEEKVVCERYLNTLAAGEVPEQRDVDYINEKVVEQNINNQQKEGAL
jgi:hypothetical protein